MTDVFDERIREFTDSCAELETSAHVWIQTERGRPEGIPGTRQTRSMMIAGAIPPPAHMVMRPI